MLFRIIIFLSCSLSLLSCQRTNSSPCIVSSSNLLAYPKVDSFEYDYRTRIPIDINNDNINDFECIAGKAGNRISKLIVPIDSANQITENPLLLGDSIHNQLSFASRFDFNGLGSGSNAYLLNHYFGVRFKVNQCMYYGWIKFSSETPGGTTSNTPVYYSNLIMQVHQTAFDEGRQPILVIQ
jgi:hypothetical protein